MKKINIIELKYDVFEGPIWLCNKEDGTPFTGIKIVDEDDIIRNINLKIIKMVDRYYILDDNGIPIGYDDELEEKEIEKLLELMYKLNERFKVINDGSFIIQDYITPQYEIFKYSKDNRNKDEKIIVDVNYLLQMHPIYYNLYLEKIDTDIKIIDNDSIIKHLNKKLFSLIEKVFTYDEKEQGYFYDKEFEIKNKDLIVSLYKQLFKRLDKLNDGSYIVRNRVSYLLGEF